MLDMMIQNQMKRSPMEGALHSLASDLGDGNYRLNSYYESESEATSILGSPVAYIPNPASAYVKPPLASTKPQYDSMNESFGEFNISYDNTTQTWTLGKVSKGFFSNLFGSKPSVLFSKSGDNATNRFLTTVEGSSLDPATKSKITDIVINQTDNTGIQEFVGGQVIHSAIDNVYQSSMPKLTGHSAADVLAADYVRPMPLTGYNPVRNEIGDAYGMRMQPQVTVSGSNSLPLRHQDFQSYQ